MCACSDRHHENTIRNCGKHRLRETLAHTYWVTSRKGLIGARNGSQPSPCGMDFYTDMNMSSRDVAACAHTMSALPGSRSVPEHCISQAPLSTACRRVSANERGWQETGRWEGGARVCLLSVCLKGRVCQGQSSPWPQLPPSSLPWFLAGGPLLVLVPAPPGSLPPAWGQWLLLIPGCLTARFTSQPLPGLCVRRPTLHSRC